MMMIIKNNNTLLHLRQFFNKLALDYNYNYYFLKPKVTTTTGNQYPVFEMPTAELSCLEWRSALPAERHNHLVPRYHPL